MHNRIYKSFLSEFKAITGHSIDLPSEYSFALSELSSFLLDKPLRSPEERRNKLLAKINYKFKFNKDRVSKVLARAASYGVTFNYHQKNEINSAFDCLDRQAFSLLLDAKGVNSDLKSSLEMLFNPIEQAETLRLFLLEVEQPSKLRKDQQGRSVGQEILLSALSSFAYSFADDEVMHSFFDKEYKKDGYTSSFWLQLREKYPHLYNRNRSLDVLCLNQNSFHERESYEQIRESIFCFVKESYESLNNHGHLAIWIDPIKIQGRSISWELASDIILFGEKFDEVKLDKGYFRPQRVAKETLSYIKGINKTEANFDIANEGFTYRDTFVCPPKESNYFGSESLLVLLQKNQRDETLIPCPSCRSHNVQGNSYPSLGVRSWECGNLLCPDRSKYNRGKRYSFKALLMQEAIDDELNIITVDSVRSWSRDIQPGRSVEDALEMLIRHYSLYGDTVHVFGSEERNLFLGRKIIWHTQGVNQRDTTVSLEFYNSAWFKRYIVEEAGISAEPGIASFSRDGFSLVHGDAMSSLSNINSEHFDAAVTSPPYYNAREYAQWNNIYCYMYDMYNIARECFRTLKEGGLYLYNIFDYFDNENVIAFSAMGDKRLILSAYTVDAFRRAGFVLLGNISWDKGDIEGKRGFNSGNFSPYYQAPFNCWEHILVFFKPKKSDPDYPNLKEFLPSILRASPVIKIINGENTHGHTAPFPKDIPELLIDITPADAKILDPFGGSATTARALVKTGRKVLCVERSSEYCALAKKLFEEEYSGLLD